jgi:hypothetical protein
MEADWEFEVGGDAPAIEARWEGFVDLRLAPERAWELQETAQFPALAAALAKLNAPRSPVWTSKCDLWPRLESDAFDPDEMDAPSGGFAHAMGCYIDLLPRSDGQWRFPALAEATCKQVCAVMGAVPLRSCRLDLMIRLRDQLRRVPRSRLMYPCGRIGGNCRCALGPFNGRMRKHSGE